MDKIPIIGSRLFDFSFFFAASPLIFFAPFFCPLRGLFFLFFRAAFRFPQSVIRLNFSFFPAAKPQKSPLFFLPLRGIFSLFKDEKSKGNIL